MLSKSLLLYLLIVGCEAAFWLVLLLSLLVRHVLHRRPLSRWLLLSLPAIDFLLVLFTAFDLKSGAPATTAHGLATVYVGFTIAFGSVAVRWADEQFAYRFASGAAPARTPANGWNAVRLELRLWLRCAAAWLIAFTLLEALIVYVGNDAITKPLLAWYYVGFGSIFLWFIFGPAWALAFFRRGAQ